MNFFAAVALCLIIGTEINSIAHILAKKDGPGWFFRFPRVLTDPTRVPPGCSGDGMGRAGEGRYLVEIC